MDHHSQDPKGEAGKLHHFAAKCHPERKHAGRGMCAECYTAQYPKAKRAICHSFRIAHSNGLCRSCYDKKLKRENPEFAERQQKICREWKTTNSARLLSVARQRGKLHRVRIADSLSGRRRKLASFGLTEADELAILQKTKGLCEICGRPPSGRSFLDIDHCHTTNQFRGLLCGRCNKGLGLLGDTIDGVEKALEYLINAKIRIASSNPDAARLP